MTADTGKPVLRVTRGLPASGKTTLAREWVAADPAHRARVNRDDLRAMLHDGVYIEGVTEFQVTTAQSVMIVALLDCGIDVICDDTNLTGRALAALAGTARAAAGPARFEVIDLTGVPLEVCLARNAARTGRARVPDERIREMHDRYIHPRRVSV